MLVPSAFPDRLICVIGLGYVGMTLAAAMCDAGFRVHGVERDPHVLDCLGEGRAQFLETGLDATLYRHVTSGALTYAEKLQPTESSTVFIVTVGTPVTPAKTTNLQAIQVVAESLATVLKSDDMVVLRSTV